ncbi:MAG: lauroyl acyltransferase [Fibrobacter sp.]|uniref:lauroyl acyltransferase n=1 Tax=Fibrobacter sp. TaxID=35828 RepID=UPI0025C5BD49|nr:lauroyl acyltransferase [Fibrobacter sp.]MBQ7078512.1 lauroyl acyltransferase [Fibrobacter sp.]
MFKIKVATYKFLINILLRLPDAFYAVLFAVVFPIYKALHKKRAYGRVEKHLELARQNLAETRKNCAGLAKVTPRDTFRGIYWNALESYRGLARFKSVEKRIVYENEHIIQGAIAECAKQNAPIAGISIHQGAFELLHRALCRYSEHVHLITDSVGDIAFREVLKNLRSDKHLTEYHPDETGRLIRELFRTKGILAMVIDQGKHTKGNTVSLFGRPSTLYLRLPQKINEMGAGIVTFRTWSEQERIIIRFESYYPPQYDVTHKPLHINPSTLSAPKSGTHAGSSDKRANATIDNSPLVTGIAHEIETWIAEHPEQWSWNYHGNFIG